MNKWNLKPGWFDGIRAFRAFIHACETFDRLIDMHNKGYIFFDENGIIEGAPVIDIDKNNSTVRIGCCIYAGCTHGGENMDLIYLTKKEFNESISRLRVVNPKHIIKFKG